MTGRTVPVVKDLFLRHRTPDPSWQATLDQMTPPETRESLSYYLIRWEPGETWSPIQRWVVWMMHPKGHLPNWIHPDAFATHPRATGHMCLEGMCTCAEKAGCWVGGPRECRGIDVGTWNLFRETGHYGQRYWVVQGTKGGHRRRYDEIEKAVAAATGMSTEPPVMGSLPYADPDNRTWAAIRKTDRVLAGKNMIDYCRSHPTGGALEERQAAERAMETIAQFLDAQVEEHSDQLYWALRKDVDLPRTAVHDLKDKELTEEEHQKFLRANPF